MIQCPTTMFTSEVISVSPDLVTPRPTLPVLKNPWTLVSLGKRFPIKSRGLEQVVREPEATLASSKSRRGIVELLFS